MNSYVSGILSSLTALIVSVLSAYAAFVVIYGKADLRKLAGAQAATLFEMGEPSAGNFFPELPIAEFAFPGPLRDRLVDAILNGRKVSTTGLALEYEVEHEPLPQPGQRFVVVDSSNHPVAVIEVTSVLVVPLGEVDLSHAMDEGEGHATVHAWRTGHEVFWQSKEMLTVLGDPTFTVDDTTLVVLERFELVERLE